MQVEELLTKRGLDYVPAGKDLKILCLNPEHDDSDPSLRIDRITGTMHCFSCGFKGNIFKHFEVKGNQLLIAKEKLKQKIGRKRVENVGYDMPEDTIPFIKEWRGISAETYRKFGAFKHSHPDFIGRVVFPIRNIAGKIVAFIGRHETTNFDPKYKIVPGHTSLPFFPIVKPIQGRIILVEGIFDMLNLHDKGLTNTVTAFGTKTTTKEKLVLLKVQGITGIDLFFDNDEAGRTSAEEVKKLAESVDMTVNIISTKVADPGELTALQVLKLGETLYGVDCINREQTITNQLRGSV
jgi:DNA primase